MKVLLGFYKDTTRVSTRGMKAHRLDIKFANVRDPHDQGNSLDGQCGDRKGLNNLNRVLGFLVLSSYGD